MLRFWFPSTLEKPKPVLRPAERQAEVLAAHPGREGTGHRTGRPVERVDGVDSAVVADAVERPSDGRKSMPTIEAPGVMPVIAT